MKILSLNIRGLASRAKWRSLREIVIREDVDLLLLQETKLGQIEKKTL